MVGNTYSTLWSRLLTLARWSFISMIIVLVGLLFNRNGLSVQAQDNARTDAIAPDNQSIVGEKLGGFYFAPKALKTRYDDLADQVRVLEGFPIPESSMPPMPGSRFPIRELNWPTFKRRSRRRNRSSPRHWSKPAAKPRRLI